MRTGLDHAGGVGPGGDPTRGAMSGLRALVRVAGFGRPVTGRLMLAVAAGPPSDSLPRPRGSSPAPPSGRPSST